MPFSGTITKQTDYHRPVDGALSFNGALQKSTARFLSLSGILSFSGNLTTAISNINISGILGLFTGILGLKKNGEPVGVQGASINNFCRIITGLISRGIINDK